MNESQVKELLQESEGTALDFKRDQYRFIKASEDEKAELLKDILSFANAFRRTEAVILIGVEERDDHSKAIVGVTEHLEDASVQQFVNSKTNRPIQFSYEVVPVDGKTIGAIRIPLQTRPFHLKQGYGKLSANLVFYRQGSSTGVANPDIIATMGSSDASDAAESRVPRLELSICDPETREAIAMPAVVERDWFDAHSGDDFNDFERATVPHGLALSYRFINDDYWRELADFVRVHRVAFPILWRVHNNSSVIAKNVIVVLDGNRDAGEEAFEELPAAPDTSYYPTATMNLQSAIAKASAKVPCVYVDSYGSKWQAVARIGDVQPGSARWSDEPFYLGWRDSGTRSISATLTADNLPEPKVCEFPIDLTIQAYPAITQTEVEEFAYKMMTDEDA